MILKNLSGEKLSLSQIRRVLSFLMQEVKVPGIDCDVTFLNDAPMRRLNQKFRHKNKTTDVLSFPLYSAREARKGGVFLGDIVISIPQTKRQAKEMKKDWQEEIVFLLIHGLLHLLGYDHEKSESQARVMRRFEKRLMTALQKKGLL